MPPRKQEARNNEIWAAYVRGESQQSIADRYGIGQQRVSEIVRTLRASIPREDQADLVLREVAFLDELRVQAMKIVDGRPAPAIANGEVVHDPETGAVVLDHSGRLTAMAQARASSVELRRLLGLDAATKVESEAKVRYEVVNVDTGKLT